jgi:hypothetical protein
MPQVQWNHKLLITFGSSADAAYLGIYQDNIVQLTAL